MSPPRHALSGKCGIYAIRNTLTDERYIGSSVNLAVRWWNHKGELRRGCNSSKLQQAWDQAADKNCFVFEVLELADEDSLKLREQYWIDQYDSCTTGYNSHPLAKSARGFRMTETQKLTFREQYPDVLKKRSETMTAVNKRLDVRAVRSEQMKKIAKRPDYIERARANLRKINADPEHKRRLRERLIRQNKERAKARIAQ